MSRYCRTRGQVLSDTHWCATCPQIEPEPNWRSVAEDRAATIERLENDLINEKHIKEIFYRRYQNYKQLVINARVLLENESKHCE